VNPDYFDVDAPISVSAVKLDSIVEATIAVANATGGATGAALTLTLKRMGGVDLVESARQVYIIASTTQYRGNPSGTVTFGTATAGSIVASGTSWALVQTDASGAFACTASDSADETVYFSVITPTGGESDVTKSCLVSASNSDAATWSA
jgi:hypothetical protein